MKQQFIKIWSWMLGLGLDTQELLALSIIHSYTSFKGGFDGQLSWIARWLNLTAEQTEEVIARLIRRRLVYLVKRSCGTEVYKSTFLEGGGSLKPPEGKKHIINTIDTIDSIDSIDPIDPIDSIENKKEMYKEKDIDSIDPIDSIDKCFKEMYEEKDTDPIDSIGSIDRSAGETDCAANKNAFPGAAGRREKRRFTPEQIAEITAPYESITDIPLEELSKRILAWEAREAAKLSAGPASQAEGRIGENDLPVQPFEEGALREPEAQPYRGQAEWGVPSQPFV